MACSIFYPLPKMTFSFVGKDVEHVTEGREGHNSSSVFDYTTRFMSVLMNGEKVH